jgi:hypothetical protein
LHRIEDRGHGLRLVHKNELPFFVHWQAATGLGKFARPSQMPGPLLRVGQVETQGVFRNQAVEQSRFTRLPRPEQEVDVGPA